MEWDCDKWIWTDWMDTWGIQAPVSPRTSSVLILILAASRNISIYDPTTKTFICIKYFFLFPDNTFLERDSDIESFLFLSEQLRQHLWQGRQINFSPPWSRWRRFSWWQFPGLELGDPLLLTHCCSVHNIPWLSTSLCLLAIWMTVMSGHIRKIVYSEGNVIKQTGTASLANPLRFMFSKHLVSTEWSEVIWATME